MAKELTPQQKDTKQELDTFKDLDILSKSKGGEILLTNLLKDVVANVDTLCLDYKKLNLQEFIGLSAQMKEKLDIVRILTRAEKNKQFLSDEMKRLAEEALQE